MYVYVHKKILLVTDETTPTVFFQLHCTMADSFSIEVMIRGYHAYKDVLLATVGEQLASQREIANASDPFAVAMIMFGAIVGHLPRRIPSACSIFLRKHGSIMCHVTGFMLLSRSCSGWSGNTYHAVMVFEGPCIPCAKAKPFIRLLYPIKKRKTNHQQTK